MITANSSAALQAYVARLVVPVQLAEAQARAHLAMIDQTTRSVKHTQIVQEVALDERD